MEEDQKFESHFGKVERRGNRINFSLKKCDDGGTVSLGIIIFCGYGEGHSRTGEAAEGRGEVITDILKKAWARV